MADAAIVILIVASAFLSGYAGYVSAAVIRADFYTRGQKLAQCLLALLLPLFGALLVHWMLRQHRAQPARPDRAFIPQREPPPDELRGLHRPMDDNP